MKNAKQAFKSETNEAKGFSACRMCIACRETFVHDKLLRFVRSLEGEIGFDVKNRVPSRAAYVCANGKCLKAAVLKKAFGRAFKKECFVDHNLLFREVKKILIKCVLENLSLAYRAGQCIVGRTKVFKEGTFQNFLALILANDLSLRSLEEINEEIKHLPNVNILKGPSKELIGNTFGRDKTGVVALLKGRISDRIMNDLMRWQSLGEFSIL